MKGTVDLARDALGADLHVTDTRDADVLTAWLGERFGDYETAVIVGGDGSLAAAYNVATAYPNIRLGYLPAGFGNASRHLLRLPDDPEGQVEVLARGEEKPIDFVEVDGRLALFAGAGWDALVAGRYAEAGANRLPGWAAAVARPSRTCGAASGSRCAPTGGSCTAGRSSCSSSARPRSTAAG